MIASIDHWIPPARRQTVWALASEIDKTISGFVRGQSVLCLVLAAFYASTLSLIGLHHSILIGVASGLLSFIPYLGSLSGLVISICVAIAQFWPDWRPVFVVIAVRWTSELESGDPVRAVGLIRADLFGPTGQLLDCAMEAAFSATAVVGGFVDRTLVRAPARHSCTGAMRVSSLWFDGQAPPP
jgi:hypothetical protein